MRGFLTFTFVCGMTAALIPWPGLFWLWALMIVVVLFTTPLESKPRTRVVKRRGERGY
jgi:hypothetical protein